MGMAGAWTSRLCRVVLGGLWSGVGRRDRAGCYGSRHSPCFRRPQTC